MKSFRVVGLFTLVLASILFSSACSFFGQQPTPGPAVGGVPKQSPGVLVGFAPAKQGKIASVLTYSGNIQARAQVNLVPRSSGRVEKILVEVGSTVKAGDVLAELDHNSLDAQLRQAEANLASAEARLSMMKSGGRPEDIASSEAQLNGARARLDLVKRGASEADLQAARGSLASAQARLDKARADLSKLKNPPSPDELVAARAAVERAAAALQKAQADYDRVAFRPDIAALPQATTLQQATIDYQVAQANFNIRMSPRAEDVLVVEKALESAEADVATAQARLDQLKRGPTDEDVTIAEASVQQALNQLLMRKSPYTDADLKSSQSSVAQAQAALEVARAQRTEANVTAPFEGVIAQRLLSEGALGTVSTPLFVLMSRDVELAVSIEEGRVNLFRTGQQVALTVPAYPGQVFPGKVLRVSPTADARSRTFTITVAPDQQDGRLRPGMLAEVKITTEQKENAILVPRDALAQKSGKSVLFVAVDGRARVRDVTFGIQGETEIEVASGIGAGDQVITTGLLNLNDGDAVRLAGQQGPQEQQGPRQGAPGKMGKPEGGAPSKDAPKPEGGASK